MTDYSLYEVVTWPESQELMEKQGFRQNAILINGEKGLGLYGSSAYLVKKSFLEEVAKGNVEDIDPDVELDEELEVDYFFGEEDDEDEL